MPLVTVTFCRAGHPKAGPEPYPDAIDLVRRSHNAGKGILGSGQTRFNAWNCWQFPTSFIITTVERE